MLESALAEQLSADESARATLFPAPNRGRDIAPFLALLKTGALDRFDAVLKLHTKKSPHLMDGVLRRRLIFTLLAGAPDQCAAVIAIFRDPKVGMAGSRWSFRTRKAMWMDNRQRVEALAAAMKPPGRPVVGFFEGSMFWFRPAALAPLTTLALTTEDFEPEAGQLDGMLHHAVERAFTISAWAGGFTVRDLRGRQLEGRSH